MSGKLLLTRLDNSRSLLPEWPFAPERDVVSLHSLFGQSHPFGSTFPLPPSDGRSSRDWSQQRWRARGQLAPFPRAAPVASRVTPPFQAGGRSLRAGSQAGSCGGQRWSCRKGNVTSEFSRAVFVTSRDSSGHRPDGRPYSISPKNCANLSMQRIR